MFTSAVLILCSFGQPNILPGFSIDKVVHDKSISNVRMYMGGKEFKTKEVVFCKTTLAEVEIIYIRNGREYSIDLELELFEAPDITEIASLNIEVEEEYTNQWCVFGGRHDK